MGNDKNIEKRLDLIENLMVQNGSQVSGLVSANGELTAISKRTNEIIKLLYNHVKEVGDEFNSMKIENEDMKKEIIIANNDIRVMNTALQEYRVKQEVRQEEALGYLKDATEIFTSKTKMRIAPNGYGNLTELGELFDGKIGAKQIGYLLRMAGLAMAKESSTVPYQNTPIKYCRQYVYTDYHGREHYGYVWNFVECKNAIEVWLNKNDLLVGFLKCSSKAKVSEYISNIYKNFKAGEYDV